MKENEGVTKERFPILCSYIRDSGKLFNVVSYNLLEYC